MTRGGERGSAVVQEPYIIIIPFEFISQIHLNVPVMLRSAVSEPHIRTGILDLLVL